MKVTLYPGDALVFFTDGILEARNGTGVASPLLLLDRGRVCRRALPPVVVGRLRRLISA